MSYPFRFWVRDDFAAIPPLEIPPADSPLWEARYTADVEKGKRTLRNLSAVPGLPALFAALTSPAEVARWYAPLGYPVLPDPTLHGGGLQVTPPGGSLAVHLDADRHRTLPGWRRALTVILFLNPSDGGALVLCSPDGDVIERITPRPGRLVAFENSDLAYHGVEPVTGDAERATLMATFLTPATAASVRTRAVFLPARG